MRLAQLACCALPSVLGLPLLTVSLATHVSFRYVVIDEAGLKFDLLGKFVVVVAGIPHVTHDAFALLALVRV